MTNDQREIHRKKRVLEYAERIGNIRNCSGRAFIGPSLGHQTLKNWA